MEAFEQQEPLDDVMKLTDEQVSERVDQWLRLRTSMPSLVSADDLEPLHELFRTASDEDHDLEDRRNVALQLDKLGLLRNPCADVNAGLLDLVAYIRGWQWYAPPKQENDVAAGKTTGDQNSSGVVTDRDGSLETAWTRPTISARELLDRYRNLEMIAEENCGVWLNWEEAMDTANREHFVESVAKEFLSMAGEDSQEIADLAAEEACVKVIQWQQGDALIDLWKFLPNGNSSKISHGSTAETQYTDV